MIKNFKYIKYAERISLKIANNIEKVSGIENKDSYLFL